jgi:hypothetical protein
LTPRSKIQIKESANQECAYIAYIIKSFERMQTTAYLADDADWKR